MAVKTDVRLLAQVLELLDSPENKSVGPIRHTIDVDIELTDGTTSGKADMVWSDRRSLSASGNEVLDLAGSLTDTFGTTLTFVEIVLVVVVNRSSTDGDDLELGPDATNGFAGMFADASDRIVIPAGGAFFWYDPNGQTVGAGSTDELNVAEVGGANTVSYDILIVGRSA